MKLVLKLFLKLVLCEFANAEEFLPTIQLASCDDFVRDPVSGCLTFNVAQKHGVNSFQGIIILHIE